MTQRSVNYVTIGKLGSTYGIKGWIKLYSYTSPAENIFEYSPWLVNLNNVWAEYKVVEAKPHGAFWVVRFANCETPEEARRFTNCEIAVERKELPSLPPGEYYWVDLIGLTVINLQGETLGVVDHLTETGANDVLVVKGKKEHWIPYLRDSVIKSIDLEQKIITVDWDADF